MCIVYRETMSSMGSENPRGEDRGVSREESFTLAMHERLLRAAKAGRSEALGVLECW